MELLRRQGGALLQVEGHEIVIELHDLVDDLGVRGGDGGKINTRVGRGLLQGAGREVGGGG